MRMIVFAAALALIGWSGAARAQAPDGRFDPSLLKGPARGQPNEVMVLGSAHLAQLPAPFQASSLATLNARLRAWKPGIIAIESLSGAQCAYLRQFPTRFADTVKQYCWNPAPARAATVISRIARVQSLPRFSSWRPFLC